MTILRNCIQYLGNFVTKDPLKVLFSIRVLFQYIFSSRVRADSDKNNSEKFLGHEIIFYSYCGWNFAKKKQIIFDTRFQREKGTWCGAPGDTWSITHREVTRQRAVWCCINVARGGEQIQEQVKSCKNCRQSVPERPWIINLSLRYGSSGSAFR